MYEYLKGVLILLVIWVVLYIVRKDLRREMVFGSILCAPLGITQLWYKPQYWNPQSLFNINPDIESFLFCFVVGGIAAILYEVVLNKHLVKARETKRELKIHQYSWFVVLLIGLFFFIFVMKTDFAYAATVAMALATLTIMISRRDLIKESIVGGILFMILFFLWEFVIATFIFPEAFATVWNFERLSGILF